MTGGYRRSPCVVNGQSGVILLTTNKAPHEAGRVD